jgi:hypothetical protein
VEETSGLLEEDSPLLFEDVRRAFRDGQPLAEPEAAGAALRDTKRHRQPWSSPGAVSGAPPPPGSGPPLPPG